MSFDIRRGCLQFPRIICKKTESRIASGTQQTPYTFCQMVVISVHGMFASSGRLHRLLADITTTVLLVPRFLEILFRPSGARAATRIGSGFLPVSRSPRSPVCWLVT